MKAAEAKSDSLRSRLQAEYQWKDREVNGRVNVKTRRDWANHIASEGGGASSYGNTVE